MKLVFGFLVPVLLAAPLAAQEPTQAPSPTPVRTTKLAENLYEIATFTDNPIGVKVLALVGPEGVLLVDSGTAEGAPAVRAALDMLGAGPVRLIVNTHYHDDHTGGNAALGKGALVIAHDAVARRLTTGLALLAPPPPGTVPALTFDHTLTLRFAGEEVRAVHRPDAHTDGDLTVQFVRAGVVAVGDLVFPDRFPFIDLDAGGTLAGYLATLATLAGQYPEGTRFVAAHGAVYTAAQVASYSAALVAMDEKVRAALAAGATLERMQRDRVLAGWPEWGGGFVTADRFIATLAAAERPAPAPSLPSVLDRLIPALVAGSGEDAVRLYRTLKTQQPPAYTFPERDLNRLGYALLEGKRTGDAVAIFALNVEENPKSWNAFDSLGEAYAAAGKRELAIAFYTKSLELNPANDHATLMLERLRAH